jgi:hypothetical protein
MVFLNRGAALRAFRAPWSAKPIANEDRIKKTMDVASSGMFVLLRMLAAWVKLTFWNNRYSIMMLTAACTGMSRVRKRLVDKFQVLQTASSLRFRLSTSQP